MSGFNAATGAVTYTPNANFNGADSFAFKVNDGTVDSSTATVSMTINSVNDAPTANSQSVTTTEDTAKAITLAGSDVEGSALAFSIAANPTKGVLSGFNSATGAVTYMPNADASGADSFAFKVNDGTVDSNTATVSISINSINDAPVLNAIGPQSITEGQLLTFAVTGSDADLDALTFSAAGLPSGASFAGNTFTWAPGFVQAGSYPVTFTVSDGTATASETVIVTIIEAGNQAPVLGAIGDRAVTEGQALAITLSATDPDGTGALTFTSSPLPSGATLIGNAFSWTPSFTQAGSQSITFIVSDGSLQDSETVTITVNEAGNQAPVLDPISPQSVTEAQTLTFTITATDPDGIVISNFAAISLPAGATFAGNRFTWTPSFVQAGAYTATFTASDGSLTSQPITITITVNEAGNQAPAVTAADQVVDEGQTLVFSVSASDVDSGSLSAITASNLPQGATYSNNQFRWTPLPTQGGVYQVTFSVNDGQLTATRTVQITVRDILLDDGEKKDTPAAKFIDIGNVQIPGGQDFLVPGDLQMLRIDLKNTANIPLKDLKIEVSSPELDINLIKGPYTINPGQKLVRYLDFEVPQDAEPGEHYIRITVSHDKFHRTKYAVVNVI
ncbi:tandem-95 repeat protein [Candidatus Woesearchaeota archaeon]|nr:tandem-95 repeat protein [Candidatus Woesearchaeota archaeon]